MYRSEREGDGMSGTVSRDKTVRRRVAGFLAALAIVVPPSVLSAEEGPVPAAFYVEEALSKNPSLAAMMERIRMKENAEIRAGALDDPKARFGVTNLPARSGSFRRWWKGTAWSCSSSGPTATAGSPTGCTGRPSTSYATG